MSKRSALFTQQNFYLLALMLIFTLFQNCSSEFKSTTGELNQLSQVAPSLISEPSSATVKVGESATFSVVAAGDALSFQWYRNDQPIPGALFASYTHSNTQRSDDGDVFKIVVSNSIAELEAVAQLNVETQVGPPDTGVPPMASEGLVPFWRKPADGSPTWSPDWYVNKGPVTQTLECDPNLSDAENGNELTTAFNNLSAGDHLQIEPCLYMTSAQVQLNLTATEGNPTVVSGLIGPNGERAIITRADRNRNMVILNGSFLIFENLSIQHGSRGTVVEVFDNLFYYNNKLTDTRTVVTANSGPTSNLSFVDNEITNAPLASEGFYIGDHSGGPGFGGSNGVSANCKVIGNYIFNIGANNDQGDGIEIKRGSYGCEVKYNFVENTRWPGLTTYGTDPDHLLPKNVFDSNVVISGPNSVDYAVQMAADVVFKNNLVISTKGTAAFRSQPHNGVTPANNEIYNNTLISTGTAISGVALSVVKNNAFFGTVGGFSNSDVSNNVQVDNLNAFEDITTNGMNLDLIPTADSPLLGAANPDFTPALDILGHERMDGTTAGAAIFIAP